jgi:rSAM/selenodomain-associated transferase 2
VTGLSIIVPVLDEAHRIGPLLAFLREAGREAGHQASREANAEARAETAATAMVDLEVIVADGGSRDGTLDLVRPVARVVAAPRGRGTQMNAGAAVASGEVLWFLHADCVPHPDSIPALRRALLDPGLVGGAFEYSIDAPGAFHRLSDAVSNRKNRLAGLFYGDMGIFIRAEVFRALGGFREWPLMEDLDLCRRMKRAGKIVILPPRISTSAERWRKEGVFYNIVRNWSLQVAWHLGASPAALARFYAFPPGRKTK